MPTIKIPSNYQPFTDWKTEINVAANTVGEAIEQYINEYPEMKKHLFTHWGILSANVLIYLNHDDVFALKGMDTPMKPEDRLILVATSTGG